MILIEEMIENLPIITDEELRDCYKGDEFENECLALFDEAVRKIEHVFDNQQGIDESKAQ